MHIPDGFLSTPVIITTYGISGGGLVLVWNRVKRQFSQMAAPRIAILAAFIFVAQMINIPISGGTSGHLLGGFLAALFVGPYAATFIIALVLLVQMLIFQDGGLTALGANILNMGIVNIGVSYLTYGLLSRFGRRWGKDGARHYLVIFVSAWLGVEAGAVLCGVELGLSGMARTEITVGLMAGVHALIGVLEGVMTVLICRAVRAVRPDLIDALREENRP